MSDNGERSSHYLRMISMVIDLGTETVLEIFYHFKPRQNVGEFLSESIVKLKLKELQRRKILKLREFNLVNSSNPNPDKFDLNLLITLLTNLFRDKIEEPKRGWETFPPAKDDNSTGADLLRLRRVRNDLVGHVAKAQLSSTLYTKLWTETENVLQRLISIVSHEKEQELKHKLTVYKTKSLDTLAVQNAIEKVQLWYEEVKKVQMEVEDLAKRSQALYEFYQEIPQQYCRNTTLLVNCGRLVLLGIWNRESEKHGHNIKRLLEQNKERLLADPVCAESEHLLFPEDIDKHFEPATIDISCLATVLLCLFESDLNTDENDAICQLREARNNYAHSAFSSTETLMQIWTDLILNIQTLSRGFSEEKQNEIKALIKKYYKKHETEESDKCLEELSTHGESLKRFSSIYKETMVKFREGLKQMEEEGIPFGEEKVVVLKLHLKGSSREVTELAETTIQTLIKRAQQMTGSNDSNELKVVVDKMLNHISNIDGATLLSSDRGCIVLFFKCRSYKGLLGLLDYFEHSRFDRDRSCLQESLYRELKSKFEVSVYLTHESKQFVLKTLDDEKKRKEEGYIPISIACRTTSALNEVLKQYASAPTTSNIE